MLNGGVYQNISTINNIKVIDIDSTKMRNMLSKNDFIDIEQQYGKKSLVRTDCISSVNFFD
jgi:hypothetical protein